MIVLEAFPENFLLFISALREHGLIISADEVSDCLLLLNRLGIKERGGTKRSLCALLAKNKREIDIFNTEFDSFFVDGHARSKRDYELKRQRQIKSERVKSAREELVEYNLPSEVAEAYAEGDDKRKQWLKDMLSRVSESPRHLPLAQDYIKRIATGWLASEGSGGLKPSGPKQDDLLTKSLASISGDEVPQALRAIETLVRRVNGAAQRRYRRSGRNGMPDLRATIHDSLRTGGVPLRPRYKKRPRTNRRIVVLCDVSESMYRFSGFALRFITALGRGSNRTSAYIFSEGMMEISLKDLDGFEETVKNSALWRRGTDVGSALAELLNQKNKPFGTGAVLIIISDAKTIRADMAEKALIDAGRAAGSILWLNPDMRSSKTAQMLSEHCTMLGCGTLEELARACERAALA